MLSKVSVPYSDFFIHWKNITLAALNILKEKDPRFNKDFIYLKENGITGYPLEDLIRADNAIINQLESETINVDCFGRPDENAIQEMKNKGLSIDERIIPRKHGVALYKTSINTQLTLIGNLVDEAGSISYTDNNLVTAFALTEPLVVKGISTYFSPIFVSNPKCFFIQSMYNCLRPLFPVNESIFFSKETKGYLLTLREYLSTSKYNTKKLKNLSDKLLKGIPQELDNEMIKLIRDYGQ